MNLAGLGGFAVGAAVSRPSRKSNQALATDLGPVYVRMPPRFEAIRATGRITGPPRRGLQNRLSWKPWPTCQSNFWRRYALKELSEAEMLRIEKHVASCRKCEFFLQEQLGWMAAMRSPFRRKVEKMIEEERKKRAAKG